MSDEIDQLMREARGRMEEDEVRGADLRPGYVERVLLAKESQVRGERLVRSLILSGSLAGALTSIVVASVVTHRVGEERLVEAAEVWSGGFGEEGGAR
ncbi:MAG: hypothetical protein AAGC74_12070 [Verrucomicrobiota bacterium]